VKSVLFERYTREGEKHVKFDNDLFACIQSSLLNTLESVNSGFEYLFSVNGKRPLPRCRSGFMGWAAVLRLCVSVCLVRGRMGGGDFRQSVSEFMEKPLLSRTFIKWLEGRRKIFVKGLSSLLKSRSLFSAINAVSSGRARHIRVRALIFLRQFSHGVTAHFALSFPSCNRAERWPRGKDASNGCFHRRNYARSSRVIISLAERKEGHEG